MDALTGQDLNRWFPLSSPSDFLYFLPARRGVDSAKKLRLISSAAGIFSPLESLSSLFHGFSTNFRGPDSTAVVSFMNSGQETIHEVHSLPPLSTQVPRIRTRDIIARRFSREGFLRKVSASSADHYRAVPLSDGYHILFTDPRTGNLCLGTDAPVGSLTRLLRKIWFRPPPNALSPLPILYTAGADTRHGVRVVATFSVGSGYAQQGKGKDGKAAKTEATMQCIVFYTVPPDMFHDISGGEVPATRSETRSDGLDTRGGPVPASWRSEESYHAIDVFSDPFQSTSVYPLEVYGQPVAQCSNLVELSLESSPEMVIWAFSAEGWARTWALDSGENLSVMTMSVQRDGSLRRLDIDGDVGMADADCGAPPASNTADLPIFDGAAGCSSDWTNPPPEQCRLTTIGWETDMRSGTVSVDLMEEVSGISRMDVELRRGEKEW